MPTLTNIFTETDLHTHNGLDAPRIDDRNITNRKIYVSHEVTGTAAANSGSYGVFFIAPTSCRVFSFRESHGTAATAGTLQLIKMTGTQQISRGTAILATTIDLTVAANTVQKRSGTTFVTDISVLNMKENERLGLKTTGALTNLQDVASVVELIIT